jgi:RecB family exonuclease
LKHRLGLERLSDAVEELDGAAFGLLAHAVLGEFGRDPAARSTDAGQIGAVLDRILDRQAARRFGKEPLAAVRVQLEQLRRRLQAFAEWQAEWARQGWRIEYVETGPDAEDAILAVDGQPMSLRGRVDRIDRDESTGRRIILDYKTSDVAKGPDQIHRRGTQWIDLQLPLYRHLVAGLGIELPVRLGYIVLPRDTGRVGCLEAAWTDAELDEADRAAAEVVRGVRAEHFWPPAEPPPPFSEELSAICQDGCLGAERASEDAPWEDVP